MDGQVLGCKPKIELSVAINPHSYTPYLSQIVYIAGQKPLFMAGIYSKWNPNSSSSQNTLSNTVYSYTIITR